MPRHQPSPPHARASPFSHAGRRGETHNSSVGSERAGGEHKVGGLLLKTQVCAQGEWSVVTSRLNLRLRRLTPHQFPRSSALGKRAGGWHWVGSGQGSAAFLTCRALFCVERC